MPDSALCSTGNQVPPGNQDLRGSASSHSGRSSLSVRVSDISATLPRGAGKWAAYSIKRHSFQRDRFRAIRCVNEIVASQGECPDLTRSAQSHRPRQTLQERAGIDRQQAIPDRPCPLQLVSDLSIRIGDANSTSPGRRQRHQGPVPVLQRRGPPCADDGGLLRSELRLQRLNCEPHGYQDQTCDRQPPYCGSTVQSFGPQPRAI